MIAKELYTEIEINASAEKVWNILTNFKSFHQWNPFVQEISGDLKVGEKLEVLLKAKNRKPMKIHPKVLLVNPNSEFRWHGKIPGFHGEHIFEIKPTGNNHVKFVQRELFNGWLTPLILKGIIRDTKPAFEEMNQALKYQAEN